MTIVASGLLLVGASLPLLAQGSSDQTVASAPTAKTASSPPAKSDTAPAATATKEVSVLATVRDKHGKIVSTLATSDFTLEEDGHPVTLSHFERQSQLPLKLGVLVDTSVGQREVIDQEKSDSKVFLDQALRESDAGFLIHFDREVELLQDVTSSKPKLEVAVDKLETASSSNQENSPDSDDSDSRGGGNGSGRRMHRGGDTLYDSIYLASNDLMKNQQGRRVLVVLSDGVDRGSKESLADAIESAQRTNTLVYALYSKGEEEQYANRGGGFGRPRMGGPMGGPMGGGGRRGGPGQSPREPRPDGKKILQQITKATGGRFFEVSKKQSFGTIYGMIQEDLRNDYLLRFAPGQNDSAGYHKLDLKLAKPKDAEVQVQAGFYSE